MSNGSTDSGMGQSPETPTRVYKFHKPVKNTYGRVRPNIDTPSSPDPWSTSSLATTPTRSSSNGSSSPFRRSRLSGSFQDSIQEPWTPTTKGTRSLIDKLASAKLELEDEDTSSNEDQEDPDTTMPSLHILDSPTKRKRELVAEEVTPVRQSLRRRPPPPPQLQQPILDSDNDDDERVTQRSAHSSSTPPSSPSRRSKRIQVVPLLTPSSSSSSNISVTTEKKTQATLSSFFTTSASKGTGILKGRTTSSAKATTLLPEHDAKKPVEPVKKLEQLFLAFSKDRSKSSTPSNSPGKRTSGLNRESERSKRYHCPQCGMPYVRGQPEDEQIHDRYHRVAVGGIDYPGYKNEVVVARFGDQELEQSAVPSSSSASQQHLASTGSLGARIVVVSMTDGGSNFEKKKVREVLELVNKELGSVEFDPETLEGCKVFLYISGKKKVVGCVVAERIKQGFEIMSSSSSSTLAAGEATVEAESCSGSDPAENVVSTKDISTGAHHSSAIFCSTVPQPAICGINRIWVSTLYRRHRVASRLLDAVRDRFIYACKLEQKDLAFSQPTGDGKSLARQYLGTDKFLVYVE
ncbi:N-acetyltransferase esco2 [Podila verticillata]|nr:N-acetyltransferase esco2 [Podila verticillata]